VIFNKTKRITILTTSGERLTIRAAIRRANKAKKEAKQAAKQQKSSPSL